MGIAEIIAFLEDRFQMEVPEDALFDEDRATINGLARLIAELVAARQEACKDRNHRDVLG